MRNYILKKAVMWRSIAMARIALNCGANPNVLNTYRSYERISPLHLAVDSNSWQIMLMLLRGGGDPNVAGSRGNTPLHKASGSGRRDLIVLLITFGADTTLKNDSEWLPIRCAKDRDKVHVCVFLEELQRPSAVQEHGFRPSNYEQYPFQQTSGISVFWRVAVSRILLRILNPWFASTKLVRLLLRLGADPHYATPNPSSHRPTMHRVFSSYAKWSIRRESKYKMISELLKGGANIDSRDYGGDTALSRAASNGDNEAIEFLVTHGADVNCRGYLGDTPLKTAIEGGHKETAKLLRSLGAKKLGRRVKRVAPELHPDPPSDVSPAIAHGYSRSTMGKYEYEDAATNVHEKLQELPILEGQPDGEGNRTMLRSGTATAFWRWLFKTKGSSGAQRNRTLQWIESNGLDECLDSSGRPCLSGLMSTVDDPHHTYDDQYYTSTHKDVWVIRIGPNQFCWAIFETVHTHST